MRSKPEKWFWVEVFLSLSAYLGPNYSWQQLKKIKEQAVLYSFLYWATSFQRILTHSTVILSITIVIEHIYSLCWLTVTSTGLFGYYLKSTFPKVASSETQIWKVYYWSSIALLPRCLALLYVWQILCVTTFPAVYIQNFSRALYLGFEHPLTHGLVSSRTALLDEEC